MGVQQQVGVTVLCLSLFFGLGLFEVNLLRFFVIAIIVVGVKVLPTHSTEEVFGGIGEDFVGNEHTKL